MSPKLLLTIISPAPPAGGAAPSAKGTPSEEGGDFKYPLACPPEALGGDYTVGMPLGAVGWQMLQKLTQNRLNLSAPRVLIFNFV